MRGPAPARAGRANLPAAVAPTATTPASRRKRRRVVRRSAITSSTGIPRRPASAAIEAAFCTFANSGVRPTIPLPLLEIASSPCKPDNRAPRPRIQVCIVAIQEKTETERVLAARDRYVARGVATVPLVVDRAEGARLWDVDGRSYIDFAGGLGCQNTGHGFPPALAAIHEQADRYLHQCFMVGVYEPYVEVCRRLAELWPGAAGDYRSLLLNSGAEAVENAVKIARAATGRPSVVVFDHAFHGRTLLTLAMTGNVKYKHGFGPYPPAVHRVPAPYRYRGVTTDDSLAALERLFHGDAPPDEIACVVLEPVQGEGGFVVMPPDFPPRLEELCERHGILYVDDEVQSGCGRTGPPWAI